MPLMLLEAKQKHEVCALRMADGFSQCTTSMRCGIQWAGGPDRRRFLYGPGPFRDIVLGRDLLMVHMSGISAHVTVGTKTVSGFISK